MSRYTEATHWYGKIGDRYQTTTPIIWEIGRVGSGERLTVPQGFPFDVSIPWYLQWLFDPHDLRFLKAACLHDYGLHDGWDRRTIGAIFHEALRADKVHPIERIPMWLAVSLRKYR